MALGLLLRDHARADHLAHDRVIRGEPLERARAEAVGAAVSDPAEHSGSVRRERERHGGRAHARELLVALRRLVDARVRELEATAQARLGVVRAIRERAAERLDAEPARGRAAAVPAHAIRHDEEPFAG